MTLYDVTRGGMNLAKLKIELNPEYKSNNWTSHSADMIMELTHMRHINIVKNGKYTKTQC